MVKTFKIDLSPKGKKISFNDAKFDKREKEKQLIIDLFRFARQHEKSMQSCLELSESIDSIESVDINEDKCFIELTRDEIKHLKNGFTYTTQAPEKDFWLENFRELFKKILNAN